MSLNVTTRIHRSSWRLFPFLCSVLKQLTECKLYNHVVTVKLFIYSHLCSFLTKTLLTTSHHNSFFSSSPFIFKLHLFPSWKSPWSQRLVFCLSGLAAHFHPEAPEVEILAIYHRRDTVAHKYWQDVLLQFSNWPLSCKTVSNKAACQHVLTSEGTWTKPLANYLHRGIKVYHRLMGNELDYRVHVGSWSSSSLPLALESKKQWIALFKCTYSKTSALFIV